MIFFVSGPTYHTGEILPEANLKEQTDSLAFISLVLDFEHNTGPDHFS